MFDLIDWQQVTDDLIMLSRHAVQQRVVSSFHLTASCFSSFAINVSERYIKTKIHVIWYHPSDENYYGCNELGRCSYTWSQSFHIPLDGWNTKLCLKAASISSIAPYLHHLMTAAHEIVMGKLIWIVLTLALVWGRFFVAINIGMEILLLRTRNVTHVQVI